MTEKRIVIGDIHGCYAQLKNIVKKSGYSAGMDEIIFVGDLFDRGKHSAEVYRYVTELKEKNPDTVSIVLGNHEDMLVHSMDSDQDMKLWDYNGGGTTKDSFGSAGIEITDVAAWIRENTAAYYECPEFFVCHGGTGMDSPAEASVYDLVWDRVTYTLGNRCAKLMITGHTPINNPTWKCRPKAKTYDYDEKYELPEVGIINIDTGCVFRGNLTAMVVANDTFKLIKESGEC